MGVLVAGAKTPEYNAWLNMKMRCTNPSHPSYSRYGGRGITVCQRWLNSFDDFLSDVGHRPSPELSLDRVDNDKGYEPDNVRWSTITTQQRNSRVAKLTEAQVEEIRGRPDLLLRELSEMYGVSTSQVSKIRRGVFWK